MAGLQLKQVETYTQAVDIAGIRNNTREFMSHDTRELTYADQLEWFYNVYQPAARLDNMRAFAGYLALKPAAYGLISRREGNMWLTGAIKPEYQGQGYGRQLFDFLTRYTTGVLGESEVWLDVLNTNERAKKLYESLGYVACGGDEDITVMKMEVPYDWPK